MSQQGRREPASDLPLRELGCDSRHLALPLHVFSWLPSLAWITAVTSPLSWYKERKSPPSWRSGACGLQRLIAPRLVFSPAGHRLLPLPFQHKAQLIAHRIKLQQSVRRSVCHARPSCLRARAYSGALSVNFEAGGEFCVQGCSDLCYKWDCNWWLPWEASATCSVPVHPLYAWLLTKLPAAGLSRLCNQPGGGKHDPSIRWRGQGRSYLFIQSHSVSSAEAKEQRRNQEKTNLFVLVLNVLFSLLPETKKVVWNFEGYLWKKNWLHDT